MKQAILCLVLPVVLLHGGQLSAEQPTGADGENVRRKKQAEKWDIEFSGDLSLIGYHDSNASDYSNSYFKYWVGVNLDARYSEDLSAHLRYGPVEVDEGIPGLMYWGRFGEEHFGFSKAYLEYRNRPSGLGIIAGRNSLPIEIFEPHLFGMKFLCMGVQTADGVKIDSDLKHATLTLFGRRVTQEMYETSWGGCKPTTGNEHLYGGLLALDRLVPRTQPFVYYIREGLLAETISPPMGEDITVDEDYYIWGGGMTGTIIRGVNYGVDIAKQKYGALSGLEGGIGYLGSISYSTQLGKAGRIMVRADYLSTEGDDPSTSEVETFGGAYPFLIFAEHTKFYSRGMLANREGPAWSRVYRGNRIVSVSTSFTPSVLERNLTFGLGYVHRNDDHAIPGTNPGCQEYDIGMKYKFADGWLRGSYLGLLYAHLDNADSSIDDERRLKMEWRVEFL